jgi:DNA-binding transcriptional regulator YdaS (Cro superfamily)
MKTITSMKAWMKAATTMEQELLAERVGTTRATLYQYATGHRTASPERAGEIERVSADMHRASKGRLPRIYRTDLSPTCMGCEYAQRCLGGRAIVSEFPIVDSVQEAAS